ncbi:hypothetical protein CLCR_05485 [Cladophialophora carrionii]|uniref:Uncharacterized protein n=1 Tax=Cladophialophora carrionii TaxID=86049 RepID=A0A1C1C9P0_9EURO|nr:hypothetical protein CLCR_05485 [Cladophialophora carrionii]
MPSPLKLTFGVEIEHLFGIKQNEVAVKPEYAWLRPENCAVETDGVGMSLPGWYPESYDPMDKQHRTELYLAGLRQAAKIIRTNAGQDAPMVELDADGLDSNGLQELHDQLRAIPKHCNPEAPYFFATGPEIGSVHVHVGVQPGAEREQEGLSTEFLQHLAFICMVFEDTITLLHHPERQGYQGTKAFKYAKSNRTAINASGHSCALAPEFSCEEAFLKIFEVDVDERDLLHTLLNKTSRQPGGKRERIVNFTNALGEDQGQYLTRTVEFRQHHGTLCTEDICEWVIFVTALARAAERKEHEQTAPGATLPESIREKIQALNDGVRPYVEDQANKYIWLFQEGAKKKNLEDLFDLLQLPAQRREYWWSRARTMKDLANTEKYKGRSTCEYPCACDPPCGCVPLCDSNLHCKCKFPCNGKPLCSLPPRRDCAEWHTDEWIIPSYNDGRRIGKGGNAYAVADDAETETEAGTGPVALIGTEHEFETEPDDVMLVPSEEVTSATMALSTNTIVGMKRSLEAAGEDEGEVCLSRGDKLKHEVSSVKAGERDCEFDDQPHSGRWNAKSKHGARPSDMPPYTGPR